MDKLSTETFCALLRNGMELWVNPEEAKKVQKFLLDEQSPKFFDFRGSPVNKFEFVGVFTAEQIYDMQHKRQGDWRCERNEWHPKDEPCDCWQHEQ